MKKAKGLRILAILLVICMMMALAACGGSVPAATASANPASTDVKTDGSAKKYEIAFSLKTVTNDDFQKAIADSIQKAVTDAGCKFTLVTAGEQTAVSTQVNQLEDLIAKKVDAIILNPMDSKAVIPVLKKAKAAGIPVVLVDTPLEAGNEDLYVTYIGTDNFNAGLEGGKKLAEALGGKGNVLIVRGANGNSAGDKRVDGFKKGIEGTGVKVVGEQPGDWKNDTAMQVMENMLQANKDVAGVFTASDGMLEGILTSLQDANRKNVQIMSVDGSKAALEMIAKDEVLGTMAQFPSKMGPKAVEILLGLLDGKVQATSVEKNIDSGTLCYTKSNMDEANKFAF